MQPSKEELSKSLSEVINAYWNLKDERRNEESKEIDERTDHLYEQISKIKNDVYTEMALKYEDKLNELANKRIEFEKLIDECNLADAKAKNLWHPVGTILNKWETGRWNNIYRVVQKGIVQIYDGTQDIKDRRYNRAVIGDIIVVYLKKDGKPGKLYDRISRYDKLNDYLPLWLPEDQKPVEKIK